MTDPDIIEQLITQLVQQAPALDAAIVRELVERLRDVGSPLALAIARVTELVGEQLAHPGSPAFAGSPPALAGVALPALAMACATLADGVRGSIGPRELEASRYEIETLLPVPDRDPGPRRPPPDEIPDVPAGNLIRGRRPRT